MTCPSSSKVFKRWLSCQRQSFHCSSGTSAHSAGRGVRDAFHSRVNLRVIDHSLTCQRSIVALPIIGNKNYKPGSGERQLVFPSSGEARLRRTVRAKKKGRLRQ